MASTLKYCYAGTQTNIAEIYTNQHNFCDHTFL